MVSRSGLSCNAIGTYSELAVALAFVAQGCCVTLPFGNQPGWDLLVQEGGVWLRVQVKTVKPDAGARPSISHLKAGRRGHDRTGEVRGVYTAEDMDVIIAVHPETGVMWRVPSTAFGVAGSITLGEALLWRGGIAVTALPLTASEAQLQVRRTLRETLAVERTAGALPVDKPAWMTEENWACLSDWRSGLGYQAIGRKRSISAAAVAERIVRTLHRLGLVATLPRRLSRK